MKSKKKIEVFPIVNGLIFIILSLLIIIPMWKVLVDSFDLKTAYGMNYGRRNLVLQDTFPYSKTLRCPIR